MPRMSRSIFLAFLAMITSLSATGEQKNVKLDGDIILGGLFPMHQDGGSKRICGALKEERGIQRMEAMLYAIDKINNDPSLLPNIKLGAYILDTCSRDTYALEQSMDFIKAHMSTLDVTDYRCSNGDPPQYTPSKPVAGVIGAAASTVSTMVANILRLFKIPQISYASTGIELSDKSRFGYFSRVVPPDNYQAQAMVDIVKALGWTYVLTLADEGNYGEKGISAFEEIAKKSGICIARSLKVPRKHEPDTFSKILNEFAAHKKAKVVVMFVNEDDCRKLLRATIDLNKTREFFWLASDSWGHKIHPVEKQEWAAEGAVTILPMRKTIHEFDDYFTNLTLNNNKRNPWFKEFWGKHFQCKTKGNTSMVRLGRCTGDERISQETSKYDQEGLVQFVIDAVYAMAHALHDMLVEMCPKRALCPALQPPRGPLLLEHIRNTSFMGKEHISKSTSSYEQEGLVPFVMDAVYAMAHALEERHRDVCRYHTKVCAAMFPIAGPDLLRHIRNVSFIGAAGNLVEFNKNGDVMGRYNIYQYRQTATGRYDYVSIGNWSNSLYLDPNATRWHYGSTELPVSVCSETCKPGWVRSSPSCCWVCIPCAPHAIQRDQTTCVDCPNGSYPDIDQVRCEKLPIQFMTLSNSWSVVPVVFSSFGILLTGFIFLVFIRFNNTPVIMASGRELCYVLQFGIFMCYVMTFVMVCEPSIISCTLLRMGLGLSLSVCYSALFTKTNRISRIFNRGIKAVVKRPSYTSPRSQLVICMCLVSVQVIGAITWLGMDLPGTTLVYPDRKTVVLRCKSTNVAIVLSLLYNMVLIILCTVYAFKTRKIPENFNEAKYIAFTMYSTCIVWLAFIPIYFGTKSDFKIQITALCMCVSISATVALGCLFAPKVYIVLFQPHKNTRQGSVSTVQSPGAQRGRPLFGRTSSRFSSLGAMNGDITSPTGLALLIAQGTAGPTIMSTQPVKRSNSKVRFEPIKDSASSEPDMSEPETAV